MNTYLRFLACAVLLISSLGSYAQAFPRDGALSDAQGNDVDRAQAWDAIFSRADQEHDAARWTAVTRTLYSADLTEAELDMLERYTEHRLGLWLERRLAAVPTGSLLRELDTQIGEINSRYLYITDEHGNRLRDDAGDFRLHGQDYVDIDIVHWDSEVANAGTMLLREYETQVDAYAMALLTGLDADTLARLGTTYPHLLQATAQRFQRHVVTQAAAARRRFVEDALLSERVRWEHESLDNVREAEAAWDQALGELVGRREMWLTEMQHVLEDTQANYQQRLSELNQSYATQREYAEADREMEHQQLLGEFDSVLEQVHRLDHLRQVSTAQLMEAQHQHAALGGRSPQRAAALEQSMGEWQLVLAEIESEQEMLIAEIVSLEQQYLLHDGVPRSAHEELEFVRGERDRLAAAVSRAEAVMDYAADLSSGRATAAESYDRYMQAENELQNAEESLASATKELQERRSQRPTLVLELEHAVQGLFNAEQGLSTAREEFARREAFYHAQDPELLEVLRLEQLAMAEESRAAMSVESFAQLSTMAAEHAAAA
ncbi:MAG: hypothetical protein LC641_05565 [Spirochaeta sp.]|nr:hypothetical protein [Spirochaeta sp.]